MKAALTGVNVSPVNMEDRKALGLRAGDTVRVHQRIQDKGKTRIQIFEGLVLARKHGDEPGATFTVRKVASGVGVEKIYPLYSPNIDKIEIVKRSKVRRAKLYFIREKVNREIKRQMRRMSLVSMSTESGAEAAAREAEEAKKAEEEAVKATAEVVETPAEVSEDTQDEVAIETTEEVTTEEVSEEAPAEEKSEETPAEEAEDTKEEIEEEKKD